MKEHLLKEIKETIPPKEDPRARRNTTGGGHLSIALRKAGLANGIAYHSQLATYEQEGDYSHAGYPNHPLVNVDSRAMLSHQNSDIHSVTNLPGQEDSQLSQQEYLDR